MKRVELTYRVTEPEVLTQEYLLALKALLGEFTLITNAGVDVHSMHNGQWNGITFKRLTWKSSMGQTFPVRTPKG